MLLVIEIPRAWFTKRISDEACKQLGAKTIPLKNWWPLDRLYAMPLPNKFRLDEYLTLDKLHAVIFTAGSNNEILIHPDKIIKIVTRKLNSLSRDRDIEN